LNAYLDSSVLLRVILGESRRLLEWDSIDTAVSSELIRVECLRTIDRARIQLPLDDAAVAQHRADVLEALEAIDLVPIDASILDRAAEPFPTLLGTPDALHLASALAMRSRYDDLLFATHDAALGTAARSMGFTVAGDR
jgi:predicted nucleic acid-binding protein